MWEWWFVVWVCVWWFVLEKNQEGVECDGGELDEDLVTWCLQFAPIRVDLLTLTIVYSLGMESFLVTFFSYERICCCLTMQMG